jgi:hypothetical protein
MMTVSVQGQTVIWGEDSRCFESVNLLFRSVIRQDRVLVEVSQSFLVLVQSGSEVACLELSV